MTDNEMRSRLRENLNADLNMIRRDLIYTVTTIKDTLIQIVFSLSGLVFDIGYLVGLIVRLCALLMHAISRCVVFCAILVITHAGF